MISFPISVVVRCVFHTAVIEPLHHVVQYTAPHLFEPFGFSEPFYNCWADCVVCMNERSAGNRFCQSVVSEATQRPNLRAVIRTIYTCCNIATLAVTLAVRSGCVLFAGVEIPVRVAAEQPGVGVTDFLAFCVITVITAEKTGLGVTCFLTDAIIHLCVS